MAWRDLHRPWQETSVDYCDVCGNLLIRRFWAFADEHGRVRRACRPDDEQLYHRLRGIGSSTGTDRE
jgi:hypothetical protein